MESCRTTVSLVMLLLTLLALVSSSPKVSFGEPTRTISSPSLEDGQYLEWTYMERNPDGSSLRSGIRSASVSPAEWNGEDCFKLEGSIDGTFQTSQGSGTEEGTWGGYYRRSDLALMYEWRFLELDIEGISVVSGNNSITHYDPNFRWASFPLRYESPKSIWEDDITVTMTYNHTSDGEVYESGSAVMEESYRWVCYEEVQVDVEAGSFNTYHVKEWKTSDTETNQNSSIYYNEEVGWWVKHHTWALNGEEKVLIRSYELTDTGDNSPPTATDVPPIEMDEDTSDSSLRLSDIFDDPDGDPLSYGVNDESPLSVTISGDIVTVEPPKDRFGGYDFNLTASDGNFPAISAEVKVTVLPVDDPPVLSQGAVDPSQGNTETDFEFLIIVEDVEGDEPDSLDVVVDGDPHSLTHKSGSLETGAVYSWSGRLTVGSHSYHFQVDGIRSPSSGELQGPEVVSSEDPVLFSPSLDVEEGFTDTPCTFTVIWDHPREEEPDHCYLVLGDGDFVTMEIRGGWSGEGLLHTVTLELEEGEHEHHFEARLDGTPYRYPSDEEEELEGPVIFDPEIVTSGVVPTSGEDGDTFTFFVVLEYGHGNFPDIYEVRIDGLSYTLSESSGELFTGMNLSYDRRMDAGTYYYDFHVRVDGKELTTQQRTLFVEGDQSDDDDDDGGSTPSTGSGTGESGNDYVLIALIVMVAVIVIAGLYFWTRRRPPAAKRALEMEPVETGRDEEEYEDW